jgi:hypothetical protein
MKPVLLPAVAIELVLSAFLTSQAQKAPTCLTTLKIEDLMDIDVTSVSKKEQKLAEVPAAMVVTTSIASLLPSLNCNP